MPTTDDPPDLSRLEPGDDLKVYYRSQRSGNEVDRKGEFLFTTLDDADAGPLYWVHTEQRDTLKHQYAVLNATETTDGEPCVAAYSVTVAADEPNEGDPPKPPATFAVTFNVERKSLLGVVDRVMKNGWNLNVSHHV
jgi:hypothetical protein